MTYTKTKGLLLLVFCFSCLIFSGCTEAQARQKINIYIPPFINEEEFYAQNHIRVLDEYQSDFSIAYLNANNTKTLYLFSSPIAYTENNEYVYFDNHIETIDNNVLLEEGYNYTNSTNDISTLFPANINENPIQVLSREFSLKYSPSNVVVEAQYNATENNISYRYSEELLNVSPTTLGVNNKIVGKNLLASYAFVFEVPEKFKIDDSVPEYILIKEAKDIKAILYKPMLYCENSAGRSVYSYQSKITYESESGKHCIKYELDSRFLEQNKNSVITMDFNINHYRSKQPDSSVYSNYPTGNRSEYSFVGQDNTYGACETYVRFENLPLAPIPLESIVSVKYGLKCMFYTKGSQIFLNRVSKDWCSLTTHWNVKAEYKETVDKATTLKNQVHYFNITELYKSWRNNVKDEKSEYNPRKGFVLCSDGNDSLAVFMANDNAQNVPFLRIDYK